MTAALSTTLTLPFDAALDRVRAALQVEGFGVLTEIDVTATLRAKIGAQVEDYRILGACNPALAHQALEVDRSTGLLLPCNVVLRATGDGTLVEIADPELMVELTHDEALEPVARQARERLTRVVAALAG